MPAAGKIAPSRAGKKQVICYLDPGLLDRVKLRARASANTLQQALAIAINSEAAKQGISNLLTPERHFLFVRFNLPARPRLINGTKPSRRGRKSIAGWFDRNEVRELLAAASAARTNVQRLAEAGLIAYAEAAPEIAKDTVIPASATAPPEHAPEPAVA